MSAAAAAAGTRIWSVRRTGAGRGLWGWDPGSAGTEGVREGQLRVRCRLAGAAGNAPAQVSRPAALPQRQS